jgi:hypothetical protein
MATLPEQSAEVKFRVLSLLEVGCLLRMGCVSREFCTLARDPLLWSHLLDRRPRDGWQMSDEAVGIYGQYVTSYVEARTTAYDQQVRRARAFVQVGARFRNAILSGWAFKDLTTTVEKRAALATLTWLALTDIHEVWGDCVSDFVGYVETFAPHVDALCLTEVWINGPHIYRTERVHFGGTAIRGVETDAAQRLHEMGWTMRYDREIKAVVLQRRQGPWSETASQMADLIGEEYGG